MPVPGWGTAVTANLQHGDPADRGRVGVPAQAGGLAGGSDVGVDLLGLDPAQRTPAEREADFDAFVSARATTLLRFAMVMVKNPHDAEDVLQDVLVKAHLHWSTIMKAGNPDAYVRRMIVNASTSFWRRRVRFDKALEAIGRDPSSSREVTADSSGAVGDRDHLVALLRQVPAKQRAVLVLRHYEGMDDATIAQILGVTEVAVRSNASRGLARLRELLGQESAGERP
ncbi:MAG: SigE family RNA polymerase sigma factor [Kineosporiaceae bacterium]